MQIYIGKYAFIELYCINLELLVLVYRSSLGVV